MENYPSNLEKKVTLFCYFKKYFETDGLSPKESPNSDLQIDPYSEENPPIRIKAWSTTRKCIFFNLSNKLFQADFKDKSQIYINSKTKMILYQSNGGEKLYLPIKELKFNENLNLEIARKISHVKNIIQEFLKIEIRRPKKATL